MYDFLDRPVTALNRGGRFLVLAMRHWVRSMSDRRCPCDALAPSFAGLGLLPALPHFQIMMTVLNHRARNNLCFCLPHCSRIAEGEAAVLSLLCAMRKRPAVDARETAELLVESCAVPNLLIALSALGSAMDAHGLFPAPPVADPALWRRP